MQNIDYIGVEKLIASLKRNKSFSGVSVMLGTKKVFYERGDKDEVLNSLVDFWTERKEANEKDQNIYEVVLLDDKGKKQLNFLFCLSVPASEKEPTGGNAKYNQYVELNIELGYLRAQNVALEKENTFLQLQVDELQDELDEADEESALGSPQETILSKVFTEDRIGSILDGLTNMFKNNSNQPAGVGGTDSNESFDEQALKICRELLKHDPKILFHLQKIVTVAQTNKIVFNHLISEIDKNL